MVDEAALRAAAALVARFAAAGVTVATAESCTGGLLAAAITHAAGASAVFERGFVTYSNASKMALLNVSERLLVKHGAVSELVALAMAEGARARAETDLAIAVTGIAGPDGGSPAKPVGLVWFGVAGPRGQWVERSIFAGNRAAVRAQAVQHALALLERQAWVAA